MMEAAPGAAAEQQGVADMHIMLLQEAQAEIGQLRAELYSTRRMAEERRWVRWCTT